jgi:hypothetical protein
VQPRSRKINSKIGIGIPNSQSKIYPVAAASLILFVSRILVYPFVFLETLDFLSEFFFGFAEFLLEAAEKLFVLAFGKGKIVVG